MPGTMSIGGLASGLQTNDIISKIMDYARLPQKNMQADQVIAKAKLAAWQGINTRVLALKTQCDSIADIADFKINTVTSSDESILTASATTDAPPGTYYLKVTQRAQVHQVASNNTYTSVNEVVGTGTMSFAFAADPTKDFSVEIDAANNTLAGIRDTINRAGEGVRAVIINTGSASNPQYQLLLNGVDSGVDSQFTVTAPFTGWDQPTDWTTTQSAQDAIIKFGEGVDALEIHKSTNTVSDLVPGLTLNIVSSDINKVIKLDVTRDTSTMKTAIEEFVSQYNSFADALEEQFAFDADTNNTGTLFGDYQLQMVQQNITSAVGNIVAGLGSQFNALAAVGITHDIEGKLTINDSGLTNALNNNLDDVAKIFGANLTSDSAYVSFAASTSDTQASGATKWTVDVTQAATRSQVTSGSAMNNPLSADEDLTVNGKKISLTLGMTLDDVIAEINSRSSETDVVALKTGADGTGTGNYLTFRRVRYGSSTNFSVLSNKSYLSGDTTGVGNVLIAPNVPAGQSGLGVGAVGKNVEGTINGEACTGVGQVLNARFGDSSNNAAKGLSIIVTATAPMTTNVQYTKGIGSTLRDLLSTMTSSTGIVTQAQNSLNTRISDLTDMIADDETKMLAKQERLYAKFNAMESQMSKLQGQGNYLASMLSSNSNSK